MTSTALTRRAVTVSTGALALCLFSGGVAFADTALPLPSPSALPTATPLPPLPGVPSPGNVVTTLDQTVQQVTSGQPTTSPPSATGPAAPKSPSTTTKKPSTGLTVAKPATRQPAAKSGSAATQQMAALANWSAPSSWDSMTPTNIALPPATGISASAGTAPAVAPLLMPQTQRVNPSAAMAELDKKSGSAMRAILLTLALAAAGAVGYGHLRVVRA